MKGFAIAAVVLIGFQFVLGCDKNDAMGLRVPIEQQSPPIPTPQERLVAARNEATIARDRVLGSLAIISAEYRTLKQQVPILKTNLEAARRTSDTSEKLVASKAYNDARFRMDDLEKWALSTNQAYKDAAASLSEWEATVAAATPKPPPAVVQASTPTPPLLLDDSSTPASAGTSSTTGDTQFSGASQSNFSGGDKSVHVNSYTRKDGTHVNSYNRSSPGSSRGGGRR